MYLQHFGLKHDPLGQKAALPLAQYDHLSRQLNCLLETRGVGIVTGEAGTGKTTALRQWTKALNPLTHQVMYQSDNHFRSFDIYAQLASSLGLEKQNRYCKLWHSLKQALVDLYDSKQMTPVWILDEAHHLPRDFLLQLPAFLNMRFDSRNILVIVLCGLPTIQTLLERAAFEATASRVHFSIPWEPIEDVAVFLAFVKQAFQQAGKHETILTESGIQLIHMASRGRLRYAHRIITAALQEAAENNLNHLPDEVIHNSIQKYKTLGNKIVSS